MYSNIKNEDKIPEIKPLMDELISVEKSIDYDRYRLCIFNIVTKYILLFINNKIRKEKLSDILSNLVSFDISSYYPILLVAVS